MYSKEEKKQLIRKFWTDFDAYCNNIPELASRPKKWILHKTKVKNVSLKFDVGRTEALVILEIGHRQEASRLRMYEILEKYKVLLEEDFENGLEWDFAFLRDNGQEVCRIFAVKEGVDMHRQQQWGEIFAFFAENMNRLQNNFMEIRDLINAEYKGQV